MRKYIAKHFGYPLQDYVKRTSIKDYYNFLKKSEKWSEKELSTLQLLKIKTLIKYANEFVPYYSKLFNDIGLLPEDVKSIEDFKKIPVLTKTIARNEQENLYSTEKFKHLKRGFTGGTTGPPLLLRSSTHARSVVWGAYYRWYEWMGIEIGDSVAELWGASGVTNLTLYRKLRNNTHNWLKNTVRVNSFEMNEKTLPEIVNKLRLRKPLIIKGYLSALLQLARYIEENDIQEIKPKVISSTSETLLPPYRKYLEKIFQAEIFDQYGCGECQSVAFECEKHNGLHITTEHVFLEVLDENNKHCNLSEGKIILTDLDNYAMPFIRYENGDIGSFSKEPCDCNRPYPLLKNISGRAADSITLKNGSMVHGVFFTDILYEQLPIESQKITRFQAYQEKKGELIFKIESRDIISDYFLEQLKKLLLVHFLKVEIKILPYIEPSESGKFRYIISKF